MRKPDPQRSVVEIERKFLIHEVPLRLEDFAGVEIEQGYLDGTKEELHVRVRRMAGRDILTVKQGSGVARIEVELDLSPEQADALWPLTAGRRLQKTRYIIPLGPREAELDVYKGALAGLVLCEVEFDTVEDAERFTPPGWFGWDVTSDVRYGNYNLARAQSVPVLTS